MERHCFHFSGGSGRGKESECTLRNSAQYVQVSFFRCKCGVSQSPGRAPDFYPISEKLIFAIHQSTQTGKQTLQSDNEWIKTKCIHNSRIALHSTHCTQHTIKYKVDMYTIFLNEEKYHFRELL